MLPGHLRVTFYTTVVAGSGSIVPIRSLQEYPCQLPVYTEEDTLSAVSSRLFQKREETKASIYKVRGKRGIKVTGALRSAGFQKIPARPQIVFNRFTCLNIMLV